jgi:hypothetical protein
MRYLLVAVLLAACADAPQAQSELDRLTASVIPHVERAAGLTFKEPPRIAVRSRPQVEAYLQAKLDDEFPPEQLDRVASAYRLFGLMSDTTDLRSLILALLAEQVVGYYDPDSTTLYVVEGADPVQLRFIVSHELVHALQDQYVRLDSMLELRQQNDARMAFQAVMEGQATLGAVAAILPQQEMPVFHAAPLILREGLVFPYVAGMDFMRWFNSTYPDTVPFGPRLPRSTEHILHPEKYRVGDAPTRLRFTTAPEDGELVYEDDLGQFESGILMWELSGSESMGNASVLGWDGDRYAVYQAGDARALVWWTVWDDEQAARKFAAVLEREWPERARPGRSHVIRRSSVGSVPAVVLVDAPDGWPGLARIPAVSEVPG